MQTDHHQLGRRHAIMRILRRGDVRRQEQLVDLLRKAGHDATQSSVSRDLRDLGVSKASGKYILPPDDVARVNGDFDMLRQFFREIRKAGPSITVVKTTIGAAQSIAVAIDRAEWPEVSGTISGDDTIFIATDSARAQSAVIARLRDIFGV